MAKILLIDDMAGVRRTVSAVLKRAGHKVTEADDGGIGLQLLKSDQFDLVITDMLMPNHDGMEVILFLEQQPKRPRVLAISGGGSQVSSDDAFMLARKRPTRHWQNRSTIPNCLPRSTSCSRSRHDIFSA